MGYLTRLNGFKVLKEVTSFRLVFSSGQSGSLVRFFSAAAGEKINLPYATLLQEDSGWRVTATAEKGYAQPLVRLMEQSGGDYYGGFKNCNILSLFPHRGDPRVPGALFELLGQKGVEIMGAASSPSAVSVLFPEDALDSVGPELFRFFSFSGYRTPEDWKAAQKGKEKLYKEVVASYQEKKPKVYGLTCREGQSLLRLKIPPLALEQAGKALGSLSGIIPPLSLFAAGTSDLSEHLVLCYPKPPDPYNPEAVLAKSLPEAALSPTTPTAVFFMNGPHFGDRYGIARDLVRALQERGVEPMVLNFTVASIVGAVASEDLDASVDGIMSCFEVPEVNRF